MIITIANRLAAIDQESLAESTLSNAIQNQSNDFRLNHQYGSMINYRGEDYLHAALLQRPDSAATHNNLGVALSSFVRAFWSQFQSSTFAGPMPLGVMQGFEGSVREFREAVRLCPDHGAYRANLSFALAAQGKYDEATGLARGVIERDRTNVSARFALAVSYEGLRELDDAVAELQEILALKPTWIRGYTGLARLKIQQGEIPAAKQAIDRALSLEPPKGIFRDATIHELGRALAYFGDFAAAEPLLKDAVASENVGVDAYLDYYWVLEHLGKSAEAEEARQRAIKLDSAFERPSTLGHLMAERGDFALAAKHYSTAFRNSPQDDGAAMRLALTQLASGDRAGYDETCQQMIERFLAPGDWVAIRRTILATQTSAEPGGGTAAILPVANLIVDKAAVEKARERWSLSCRERGLLAYRSGDWGGAVRWSTESRDRETRTEGTLAKPINFAVEAMALWRLGKMDKAQARFDEAVAAAPKTVIGADWIEWVVFQQLRQEAAKLLKREA